MDAPIETPTPTPTDDAESNFDIFLTYIIVFFKPTAIGVGIFGNIAAIIIILVTPALRRLASNVYLVALAVFELVFFATLFVTWLDFVAGVAVYRETLVGCKLLTFVAQASDTSCVLFIVAVSVDRFLLVFFAGLRTRLTACGFQRWSTFLTIATAASISAWTAVYAKPIDFSAAFDNETIVAEEERQFECVFDFDDPRSLQLFNTIDAILTSFLPSAFILALNLAVIYRLRQEVPAAAECRLPMAPIVERLQSLKRRSNQSSAQRNATQWYVLRLTNNSAEKQAPLTELKRLEEVDEPLGPLDMLIPAPRPMREKMRPQAPKVVAAVPIIDRRVTRGLLVVTTVYVLLTLPSYVVRTVNGFHSFETASTAYFVFRCAELAAYCLYFAHHSLNFFFCTFFSPQMRRAPIWLFRLVVGHFACCPSVAHN